MIDTSKFQTMAEEARELQARMAELTGEMVKEAMQMAISIVMEEFDDIPGVKTEYIHTLANITPCNDIIRKTKEVCATLKAHKQIPTRILIDPNRMCIQLLR